MALYARTRGPVPVDRYCMKVEPPLVIARKWYKVLDVVGHGPTGHRIFKIMGEGGVSRPVVLCREIYDHLIGGPWELRFIDDEMHVELMNAEVDYDNSETG